MARRREEWLEELCQGIKAIGAVPVRPRGFRDSPGRPPGPVWVSLEGKSHTPQVLGPLPAQHVATQPFQNPWKGSCSIFTLSLTWITHQSDIQLLLSPWRVDSGLQSLNVINDPSHNYCVGPEHLRAPRLSPEIYKSLKRFTT